MENEKKLEITPKKTADTCMAVALLFIILGVFLGSKVFFTIAACILIVGMLKPMLFFPIAWVWFGFGKVMGIVMSKVVLAVIYFVIVSLVAVIRRLAGKDTLKLREWKKGTASVFCGKEHLFSAEDLRHPY